jgi:hypothetical protein
VGEYGLGDGRVIDAIYAHQAGVVNAQWTPFIPLYQSSAAIGGAGTFRTPTQGAGKFTFINRSTVMFNLNLVLQAAGSDSGTLFIALPRSQQITSLNNQPYNGMANLYYSFSACDVLNNLALVASCFGNLAAGASPVINITYYSSGSIFGGPFPQEIAVSGFYEVKT